MPLATFTGLAKQSYRAGEDLEEGEKKGKEGGKKGKEERGGGKEEREHATVTILCALEHITLNAWEHITDTTVRALDQITFWVKLLLKKYIFAPNPHPW